MLSIRNRTLMGIRGQAIPAPSWLTDAKELWRLLQRGGDRLGLGIADGGSFDSVESWKKDIGRFVMVFLLF